MSASSQSRLIEKRSDTRTSLGIPPAELPLIYPGPKDGMDRSNQTLRQGKQEYVYPS